MEVRVWVYGLEEEEIQKLKEKLEGKLQTTIEFKILKELPATFPSEGLNLMILKDEKGLLKMTKRFSPTNWKGAPQSFDGKNIIILFSEGLSPPLKRNLIDQAVAWTERAITGKYNENPWGPTRGVHKSRIRPRTWVSQTPTEVTPLPLPQVQLSPKERHRMALIVDAFGAFNYEVGMAMEDSRLFYVYWQTLKALALVAEQARTGAGKLLLETISKIDIDELSEDIKKEGGWKVLPKIEAILVFGKPFEELNEKEREICNLCRLVDEFRHFSRIMDPDLMVKRIVGVADAGNPRITRLLGYAKDYRVRLGIFESWPIPSKRIAEAFRFKDPLHPILVRRYPPYLGIAVSASTPSLARDIAKILERLIIQYSIEETIAMVEDWLSNKETDPNVSIVGFQIHNDGEKIKVLAIGIGGGAVRIRGSVNRIIQIPKGPVGKVDFQSPIYREIIEVKSGDTIEAVPATFPGLESLTLEKPIMGPVARIKINSMKHRPSLPFQWTKEYVLKKIKPFIEEIKKRRPDVVRIQVGHIHADRDFGPEQRVACFIAKCLIEELEKLGIKVEVEPLIDNYHVVDRVNVANFLEEVSKALGRKVNKVAFEASLLSRELGNQVIKRLYQRCPEKIVVIGSNVYLKVSETMIIELYDGVGDFTKKGRQGCVPFEAGYEIRRLNPKLASKLFKETILKERPDSIIAKWWKEKPDIEDFEELTFHFVYTRPPEERARLKREMEEVDRPYKEKILEGGTELLDEIMKNKENVVLIHILEGVYAAQENKFAHLMQLAGLLPIPVYRISFQSDTGEIEILDASRLAP
jgi:hypothetical protein